MELHPERLLLSACEPNKADIGVMAKSDLSREPAPVVPAADAQALLEGNNAFAFDLYQQVSGEDRNLIYSPYSISLAMAMVYGGAAGETASQIASSLHFNLPPEQLHPAWNALSLDLAQRPAQSKKIDRKNPMLLNIANAVWGQLGYPFEQGYLDLLAVNYGAGVRLVDFSAAPDAALQQINKWVDQETDGKIKEVMPPGSIDPDTRMVLANALFQGGLAGSIRKKVDAGCPLHLAGRHAGAGAHHENRRRDPGADGCGRGLPGAGAAL